MRISACSSDVCSSDLRFLARELDAVEAKRDERDPACEAMREAIFTALGLYVAREGASWHADIDVPEDAGMGEWIDAIGARRALPAGDREGEGERAERWAARPEDGRQRGRGGKGW